MVQSWGFYTRQGTFCFQRSGFFCRVTLYLLRTLVRFQVLTAASVKLTVFWDMAPCSLIEADRRFRSAYCLHHQHRFTCKRLHGDISQKAAVFILATSIHIFVLPHYCYVSRILLRLSTVGEHTVCVWAWARHDEVWSDAPGAIRPRCCLRIACQQSR
jgi:hypothetical protein